jgi:hypothetical protein
MSSCVCLILILCISSNCGTLKVVEQSNSNTVTPDTNNSTNKSADILYYLDVSNPSISQTIEPANDSVEGARFVQVEVAEVLNPKKHALTFEVNYLPRDGAKVYLGSFSLYPADNPGKFIVATHGRVEKEGSIVLSMVLVDKIDARDPIRVGVKRIKFLKDR